MRRPAEARLGREHRRRQSGNPAGGVGGLHPNPQGVYKIKEIRRDRHEQRRRIHALLMVLEAAVERKIDAIVVRSDSELLVNR